jgi:hypothetical protein
MADLKMVAMGLVLLNSVVLAVGSSKNSKTILRVLAAPSTAAVPGCHGGYRLQSVIHDYALGEVWPVLANCSHPEMPWMAVAPGYTENPFPVSSNSGDAPQPMIVVASGAHVRLWRRDATAHIDLYGVALDSGQLNELVRVRAGSNSTVLRGRVRAADSVELSADSVTGFGAAQ